MSDPSQEENLHNDFYAKYVGCYAKRFYQPFTKDTLKKIIGFELRQDSMGAYIQCKDSNDNKLNKPKRIYDPYCEVRESKITILQTK